MLQTVLTTLFQVMVPLSIPVIVGALLKKFRNLDTKPLLTVYLYFLSPAILLETLTTAEITYSDVWQTIAFCLVNLAVLWALATLVGRLLKLPAPEAAGLTLISTLTNSVNYGLPLILLAFGKLGIDKAALYVIVQMILTNTIGVYFAARSQFTVRGAIRSVFALPAIYTAMLAGVLRAFDWQLPSGLAQGVSLAAAAYSPVVLTILGAQMMSVIRSEQAPGIRKVFWTGIGIRMLVAPLVAVLVLHLLRIEGLSHSVFFILASMPVAVNAVVLAERFNASPQMLSRCILWTTLASFLVLPVLLSWASR